MVTIHRAIGGSNVLVRVGWLGGFTVIIMNDYVLEFLKILSLFRRVEAILSFQDKSLRGFQSVFELKSFFLCKFVCNAVL